MVAGRWWAPLGLAALACGGCLLPYPTPRARAGRLTTMDGRPAADATVVVESLGISTPPSGAWQGRPLHRFETRTDAQGGWRVPGKIAFRFGIPVPDAMPVQVDEYTFTASDGQILRRRPDLTFWRPQDDKETSLRPDWEAPPPTNVAILPVFGVMAGEAQTISGHLGALLLVFRNVFGAGLRVAAEAGVTGAGASAAAVLPLRGEAPMLGLELGGRYLRPWSNGASGDWIAPEVAVDFINLRFTLTLLGLGTSDAPAAGRSPSLGVGWGFF